jgi:hypothetical protein
MVTLATVTCPLLTRCVGDRCRYYSADLTCSYATEHQGEAPKGRRVRVLRGKAKRRATA